jgi:hypothetical protein
MSSSHDIKIRQNWNCQKKNLVHLKRQKNFTSIISFLARRPNSKQPIFGSQKCLGLTPKGMDSHMWDLVILGRLL